MSQTRREFLTTGGGGLICTCAAMGIATAGCATSKMATVPPDATSLSESKLVVDLAKVPALSVVGGSAKLEPAGSNKKICIVRSGEEEYEAFINRCTHRGKELDYRHGEKKLRCVSLGHSSFDLQGQRLGGPAKENLTVLAVTRVGDSLEIAL